MAGSRIDYLRFALWLGDSVVKMIGHCAKLIDCLKEQKRK
jgi:hypothetical protein